MLRRWKAHQGASIQRKLCAKCLETHKPAQTPKPGTAHLCQAAVPSGGMREAGNPRTKVVRKSREEQEQLNLFYGPSSATERLHYMVPAQNKEEELGRNPKS